MRSLLGVLMVALLSSACTGGKATPTADAQAASAKAALQAAFPALRASLAGSTHAFTGMHVSCQMSYDRFEYTIRGSILGAASAGDTGLSELTSALVGEGWEQEQTAGEGDAQFVRDDVLLYVQRSTPNQAGLKWNISVQTDCVGYSDEDVEKVQLQPSDDLSTEF